MRNLFLVALSALVFMFSGCATKEASVATGLEGTDVPAYMQGFDSAYVDVKTAEKRLKAAGYDIVATYKPVKKGTTIVFTNDELKAEAAKPKRGHAAILRLFVDAQEKMISFSNPVYFGKAYMQDQYNHAVFNAQLEKINKAFPGLKASPDKWAFDGLASYHFMVGMPYYEDPDELAKGTNEELLAKANGYKKGKLKVFELKLSDNSYLVGYELGKRTSKFVKKIGRANAGLLPWCIAIEDGVASALSAKYHIAISYPLLDMNGFMGIMTVPGAVVKDLSKPFN